MIVPLWVTDLADAFWQAAGMREPFPRALRRPIARALQMVVITLPQLRQRNVLAWLRRHAIGFTCNADDRRLQGCLAAGRGWGYVFMDGADPEDEQRPSLAHELAHFLRHYWQPRRAACHTFGNQIMEVLDGPRRRPFKGPPAASPPAGSDGWRAP
jgi:hypothetical protein